MAGKHPAGATNQKGTNPHCDRVVHARMENVVKSAEFVLDIPGFDKYLRAGDSRQGPDDYLKISSDYNSDGIMANIQIHEECRKVGYQIVYCVKYVISQTNVASLRMDQISFNFFDISMEVLVCQDKNQFKVASVKKTLKGNRELSVCGTLADVSASNVLQGVLNSTQDTTFRVVLNVKATAYKQPQLHSSVVGLADQCDPPFLESIQNGDDSDVQLVCDGEAFPVHSLIMKNVSLVFRRMLEAPMKEAAMRKIVMEDMSADTTKRMVDYIYKGRVNVGSDSQVVDLLYAAEKYGFDLLKTACLKHMVASMSDDNITNFLHISTRVNAGDEVVEPMVTYCLARIVELRKREEFQAFAQANPMLFLGNLKSQ